MSFKEKRATIWGMAGLTTFLVFYINGFSHNYSPMSDLLVALTWGICTLFGTAAFIKWFS